MKILFLDIETSPNLAYVWGMYEQNVLEFVDEYEILSFSYKWAGTATVRCLSQRNITEKGLIVELHRLLEEADIAVAHNGDKFDFKKSNSRFIAHGLRPPAPYKTVDTLKVAKRYFAFNSNKLDDLGRVLRLGRKVKHSGFEMWKGCLAGDSKSWNEMETYNKKDVTLLEKVYNKLLPWMAKHPNMSGELERCPKCNNGKIQQRGYRITATGKFQRYQCQACGGWFSSRLGTKLNTKMVSE